MHDAGDTEFGYVVGHGTKVPDHIGAFERGRTEQVQFLRSDVTLDVVTYRRSRLTTGSRPGRAEEIAHLAPAGRR